jgi:hypothetical protein
MGLTNERRRAFYIAYRVLMCLVPLFLVRGHRNRNGFDGKLPIYGHVATNPKSVRGKPRPFILTRDFFRAAPFSKLRARGYSECPHPPVPAFLIMWCHTAISWRERPRDVYRAPGMVHDKT